MSNSFIRSLYYDRACFGSMIATSVRPYYEFVDGKRTDKVLGYRYDVVLPQHGYEPLAVKVPGAKTLDVQDCESILVEFDDLCVRPYVDYRHNNALAVTATATAVRSVEGGRRS